MDKFQSSGFFDGKTKKHQGMMLLSLICIELKGVDCNSHLRNLL